MIRDNYGYLAFPEPERSGAPLAPKCCLCTARHLDGDPCVEVRQLAPGVTGPEARPPWGNHKSWQAAAKASYRAQRGVEAAVRREQREKRK